VAVVGASAREDSMGEWSLKNLQRGGFSGVIFPVNPAYKKLAGLRCYASLSDLPETPDLVVFAVGDHRLENALDAAIALQIPAAVIMSSLYLDDDHEPLLKDRIATKIQAANMLVCGANGMGFYNFRDNVWACGFDSRMHDTPGNASLISHSGAGMSGIIDCEERLAVNFAVSTGNELSVTMDQYLDFVLDLPETKVVGLFIETARRPQGFRDALQKAAEKNIPIVALKVGRTERSAELAISHSGAMAGIDDTYDALFHLYGVHRVHDMDELATAMITFAQMHPIGPGGLVTLHDSGGEQQLLVDLANEADVSLTELNEESVRDLQKVLDPELPAINPLDAWSRGGDGAIAQMAESLSIMMCDSGAALGAVIHNRAPDGVIYPSYIDYMQHARKTSGKPVALVSSRQGTGSDPLVASTTHNGFPVLDGVAPFLRSVRGLMNYRDFRQRPDSAVSSAPATAIRKWSQALAENGELDEARSLEMLRDFNIEACNPVAIDNEGDLHAAAQKLQFPLVLKAAAPGLQHKTEQNGVFLHQCSESELIDSYRDIESRIGPAAILAEMAPAGVEMILGARRDPQFGPVVILGFGGIFAEVLKDVVYAIPPFDANYALQRLQELRLRALLDGVRGAPASCTAAFCDAAESFSAMVDALRDDIQEIDVNPLIVSESRCVAVDALVISSNVKEAK